MWTVCQYFRFMLYYFESFKFWKRAVSKGTSSRERSPGRGSVFANMGVYWRGGSLELEEDNTKTSSQDMGRSGKRTIDGPKKGSTLRLRFAASKMWTLIWSSRNGHIAHWKQACFVWSPPCCSSISMERNSCSNRSCSVFENGFPINARTFREKV